MSEISKTIETIKTIRTTETIETTKTVVVERSENKKSFLNKLVKLFTPIIKLLGLIQLFTSNPNN